MPKEKDNLHFILLNAGRAVHHADWNWKGISSPFTRLYLVEEGHACLTLPDGTYRLRPGYLYLVPAFTLHSYQCDDYFSLYYCHIYEEQPEHSGMMEELMFPVEMKATSMDVALMKRLLEINPGRELKRYDPSTYDNTPTLLHNIAVNASRPYALGIETQGILLQLFSRFVDKATFRVAAAGNRIKKALHYIRKNINQPITTHQLATICCLTNDHFIRLFKKEMDCTPLRYIHQKKIEKAQLMLIVDNLSIKDIAYSLSFENISYFNRIFKRMTGMTPTHYQEAMK